MENQENRNDLKVISANSLEKVGKLTLVASEDVGFFDFLFEKLQHHEIFKELRVSLNVANHMEENFTFPVVESLEITHSSIEKDAAGRFKKTFPKLKHFIQKTSFDFTKFKNVFELLEEFE